MALRLVKGNRTEANKRTDVEHANAPEGDEPRVDPPQIEMRNVLRFCKALIASKKFSRARPFPRVHLPARVGLSLAEQFLNR